MEGYAQIKTKSEFWSRVHYIKTGASYFLSWVTVKWNDSLNAFKTVEHEDILNESEIVSFRRFQK